MHPILDALDNTQYDWIKKLLFTFNEGNIGKFEALAPLFPQEVRDGCGEPYQTGEAESGYSRFWNKTTRFFDRRSVSWR